MNYQFFDQRNYQFEVAAVQDAADRLTRNFAKIEALDQPALATREFCIAATLDDGERPTGNYWFPSAKLQEMVVDGLGIRRWPKKARTEAVNEILYKLFFPIMLAPQDMYGYRDIKPEHRRWELEKLMDDGTQISRFVRHVTEDLDFADGVFTIGPKIATRLKDRHTYRPKGKDAEKAIALVLEIEKNYKQLAKVLPMMPWFEGKTPLLAWKEYIYQNCNEDGTLNEQHLWYWRNIESDTETSFRELI